MSIPVFPALPGRGLPVKRTPVWSTQKQRSISGQETRQQLWSYPQWRYELTFDFLRSTTALSEWQAVLGLFNQLGGSAGAFAYSDAADNTAVLQPFGVGDGVTSSFQLVRALGGFTEPVFLPVSTTVFRSDWQGITGITAGSRTNLLPYSMPQTAGWSANGVLSIVNATVPDGGPQSSKFVETTGNGGQSFGSSAIAVAAGQTYTQTIWAKALTSGAKRYLVAFFDAAWIGVYTGAVFDVVAGTVAVIGSGVTATIMAGTGGWYRCTATAVAAAGVTQAHCNYRVAASATDIYANQTGDGISGLLLFGAQFETGTLGTSYMATSGAPATATDYGVSATGSIVFIAPPPAGTSLLWSGTFNWLCRFDADEMQFQQDYQYIWSLKSCMFTTVKL